MKFKLFSTAFEVSFLTVAIMSAVIILDSSFKVTACIFSAVIHECGHIAAMRFFSITPSRIKLRLFDIVIDAKTDKNFISDFVITLCGPLANLVFAVVFYFFSDTLFIANLTIGIFNLLPVETFDGGHALSLLLSRKLSLSTTKNLIKILTLIILVPIFLSGILVLFYSKYNYSLLLISLYLVAILFLK